MWKGLSSKIFDGDTPEGREAKLKTLETQIEESENAVHEAQEDLRFVQGVMLLVWDTQLTRCGFDML